MNTASDVYPALFLSFLESNYKGNIKSTVQGESKKTSENKRLREKKCDI